MTSPTPRSVVVRLSMDTSSYIAGASRAEASTLSLEKATAKVGPSAATSMEQAAKSAGTAEGALGKLNGAASTLGLTMAGLAGAGVTVGAALSVKWAADYQSALTRLVTTAGESQANIKMVGQGFLDMAGQVGISADEIAKAAYTAESAGFHGADTLTIMKAATEGARQEQADLGKVVNATTTILHDYHLKASDAALVTSQLITAVSHGKVTFDELTGSLDAITPLAARMNITVADVTGTLAAMTASGMSADQATQNMQNTLEHLANPTSTMIAELAQLGVSTDDLANSLSQHGLAGTLQYVEQAIVQHLDPATQRVLLPALNQSKSAAQDLQIMLGQMPPTLQKLAQGLLDGTTTQKQFRQEALALGGQAGVMGDQFLSLYKSADGFNNVLKAGGPEAQVFTAAMAKAFGTTAALNVALQTTGENAAATNAAIADISKAVPQADGNIKGWSEVQGNFNQQLAQTEAHMKSLAIEAGQHMLPVLTDGLHWLDTTGIPAVEHLGSAVGGAVHWFSQLPAPVRDAALALAALRLADHIGLLDRLGSGVGGVKAAFQGFREEMALQQTLWAMNERSASLASHAYGDVETALGNTAVTLENASAGASRLEGAMGTLAVRGKAAGQALMGAFGGGFGLSIAGATVFIGLLDAAMQKATDTENKWVEGLKAGGAAARQAQQEMDATKQKTDLLNHGFLGVADSILGFGGAVKAASPDAEKARQSYDDWYRSLTVVQERTEDVRKAHAALDDAMKHNPPTSQAVANAQRDLALAEHQLSLETDRATQAQKSQIDQMKSSADALVANANAQAQAQRAQVSFTQSLEDYRKIEQPTQANTLDLADAARNYAQTASDAAVAQAKANGVTDTGSVAQQAYLKALQDAAHEMGVNTPASINTLIEGLLHTIGVTAQTVGSFQVLGAQTDDNIRKLHYLGYVTVTLPNGNVVVTADTNPAEQAIRDLLNYARSQAIEYRATLPSLVDNTIASGSGRMGTPAIGGWISGPGTGTSDTAGVFALSHGEFVVNAAAAQANARLLEALNGGAYVHTSGVPVPGYAAGGWVGLSPNGTFPVGGASVPVSVDPASVAAVNSQLHNAFASAAAQVQAAMAAGGGNTAQWAPLVMQALSMLGLPQDWLGSTLRRMNQESGGSAVAINLWDSNAAAGTPSKGLMQVIDPTFAAYHLPGYDNIWDPLSNILASMRYAMAVYGSLPAAYDRAGGYDTGGLLMPGTTLAVNGTGRPETIRTAEQEQALQARLVSKEMATWLTGASGGAAPTAVHQEWVGLVVNGDVHTDPDELARASTYRVTRLLAQAGLR